MFRSLRDKLPVLTTYDTHLRIVNFFIFQGLYPESHGIVDNNMYDPVINKTFTLPGAVKMMPEWWGGEPVSYSDREVGVRILYP